MGEGRGGRGAISYDGEKALSSINMSITSGFNPMIIIADRYLLTALRSEGLFIKLLKVETHKYVMFLFL
jgi:hypothetical protein